MLPVPNQEAAMMSLQIRQLVESLSSSSRSSIRRKFYPWWQQQPKTERRACYKCLDVKRLTGEFVVIFNGTCFFLQMMMMRDPIAGADDEYVWWGGFIFQKVLIGPRMRGWSMWINVFRVSGWSVGCIEIILYLYLSSFLFVPFFSAKYEQIIVNNNNIFEKSATS